MRRVLMPLLLAFGICYLAAQEGSAYRNTASVNEKFSEARENFGRPALRLETVSDGFYDDDGRLTHKLIYRANKTFLGRELFNRTRNPFTEETLKYDQMGQLTGRSVKTYQEDIREHSFITYDAKGRILEKTSTRLHTPSREIWELEYNQVGYVHHYYQVIHDENGRLKMKKMYNYFDDLVQNHYYIYDQAAHLTDLIARCAISDTLISRVDYDYDRAGNLIQESHYDHTGTATQTEQYAYDSQGRLIQKSLYLWNPRFGHRPVLRKQWDFSYTDKPQRQQRRRQEEELRAM